MHWLFKAVLYLLKGYYGHCASVGMLSSVGEMHLSGSAVICVTHSFKNWTLIQGPGQLPHDTLLKPLCFVSLILTHCYHASCQTYHFVQ